MISKCKTCIHGPECDVTPPEWAERLIAGYGYGTDGARSSQGPRGARCACYRKRPNKNELDRALKEDNCERCVHWTPERNYERFVGTCGGHKVAWRTAPGDYCGRFTRKKARKSRGKYLR